MNISVLRGYLVNVACGIALHWLGFGQ